MTEEPINFVDRLIRGTILTTYDFAGLSIFGLLLPFIKAPRVWRRIVAIQKRFSTLTHLFLWILITTAIASGNDELLVSRVAGLNEKADVGIVYLLGEAILICAIMDGLIRLCLMLMQNRKRRLRYQSLIGIAIANLYLGASVMMLLTYEPSSPFGRLDALVLPTPYWFGLALSKPVGILFAGSLAFVVAKMLAVKGWKRNLLLYSSVLLVAPPLLLNLSVYLYILPYNIRNWLAPAQAISIRQYSTKCMLSSGRIRVSSNLILSGTPSLPIDANSFTVYYVVRRSNFDTDQYYVGRVLDNQPGIVISNSVYTPINLLASFEPADASNRPNGGQFPCVLSVLNAPSELLQTDESDVEVQTLPTRD